jgi:drug/metabolite transporter (DMT)-like permease
MTGKRSSPHLKAVLQALLVTFLWSTSWVLVKIGLEGIPSLTFAGLRYSLAFLCLLPLVARRRNLEPLRRLRPGAWIRLAILGLLYYALTQGAQFVALDHLPAITLSLLLSFTSVTVALLGIALLSERPSLLQWGGIILNVIGVLVFFHPLALPTEEVMGLVAAVIGVLANSFSSVLGRSINRRGDIPPTVVTVVSMGIGALILLGTCLLTQSLPRLSLANWAIVIWLAVVNTAFAFTLWNHTLRTLSATESSIINNTMLIQITLLAWVFLGERLTWQEVGGLVAAGIGALLVQIRHRENQDSTAPKPPA